MKDVHDEFRECVCKAVSDLKNRSKRFPKTSEKEVMELARIRYEAATGLDRIENAQRITAQRMRHKRYKG